MFVPSPLSVFFANSGVISELTAFVDSGARLRIYNSFLGKNLYVEKTGGFKDFFGIILLFGSFLSLFVGYHCLHHHEYLKFLASILGFKKVYFSILLSRIMAFNLAFLLIVGIALASMRLRNISLSSEDYLYLSIYIFVMALLFLFFSVLGVLAGSITSKSLGIVAIIVLWFSFIFLIPGAISKIVSGKAGKITSAYNLEQKKLKLLTDFESKALIEAQRYTNMKERIESEKKLIESYWDNEFKKINALEAKMQADMRDSYRYFQQLSVIFPSTFYLTINNEISSKGYENFFNFYRYIQQLQQQFIRFYFDKRYYSNYKKIEPFVKGEENIFYAKSRLPGYFLIGVLLTIFYVALLSIAAYSRFKKCLFVLPDKTGPDANKLDLSINSGESVVLLTTAGTIINQLYNVFSGIFRGFNGKVMVNKEDIVPKKNKKKEDFVYLCQPDKIPGNINAGDFISFFKKLLHIPEEEVRHFVENLKIAQIEKKNINELKEKEKGKLLFALARLKNSRIYMIHDFAKGMPIDFIAGLKVQVKKLKDEGATILYLSNDILLATKIADRVTYLITDPSLPQFLDNYTTL
jgi:ABC-type Na+ transport system ATPase subunit NatA